MTWYAWTLIAVLVVSALATVLRIGEPREPLTPGAAVIVLVGNGLVIWAIIALAERTA